MRKDDGAGNNGTGMAGGAALDSAALSWWTSVSASFAGCSGAGGRRRQRRISGPLAAVRQLVKWVLRAVIGPVNGDYDKDGGVALQPEVGRTPDRQSMG